MPTQTRKVFLSSTFIDLKEYREAAVAACQRVGLLPVYMESFPPDPRDAVAFCKAKVDEADLFLGLYAHRYGYVPDGSKVSITEMEYDWARERGLPVYLFVVDPDVLWLPSKIDKGADSERLERFKDRVGKQHTLRKFRDPQTFKEDVLVLGTELAQAQPEATPSAASPASPTARVLPAPPEMHSVPPYILTTRFIGRRPELDALDAWARSADPMLIVEAIGGMGKSALTWEWARERAPRAVPRHAGTLWWSFYEGGASTASFVREALAYVTGADPESLRSVPPEEQAQRLLAELRRRPFLLVLDGFERLLTAYHRLDPSKLRDEEVPPDHRACTSPRTEDLLRQLTACSPSNILVTTRLMPSVLENKGHQPVLGVQRLDLHGLSPADGENLLRNLGVYGDSAAIRRLLQQFDNHSLLISVLAGRILDYRLAPGDFDGWREDPKEGGGLHLSELDLKQRRRHILAYAFDGLDSKKRQLLSRIAVLNDAADYSTLSILNPYLPYPISPLNTTQAIARREMDASKYSEGRKLDRDADLRASLNSPKYREAITDFDLALNALEERGLLQWDRLSNSYDLHPVVRGYALDQLEENDRARTYERIRDHFESLPPEDADQATELSDLKNTFQIYRALIGAGHLEEAASLYINRFSSALFFSITSYPAIIELLLPLVREDLNGATPEHRFVSMIMNDLGIALFRLGRIEEALQMQARAIQDEFKTKKWPSLCISFYNYAKYLHEKGRLAASIRTLELSYELSLVLANEDCTTLTYFLFMIILTTQGQWQESQTAYQQFVARPTPPRRLYRIGDIEHCLCQSRLYNSSLTMTDLEDALAAAIRGNNLLGQSKIYQLQAEFCLGKSEFQESMEAAEQALEIAKKIGIPASYAKGCMARVRALQGSHAEARKLVEEFDVDRWQAAEVYMEIGDQDKARELAISAYKEAWADGSPHIHWWPLERSKRVLAQLGVPKPQCPPFNPSKIEPIPLEAEIRAAIEELKAKKLKKESTSDPTSPKVRVPIPPNIPPKP
jgi:tetratricopeptide (TPR) repeat protein